jgi:hypothetical protein
MAAVVSSFAHMPAAAQQRGQGAPAEAATASVNSLSVEPGKLGVRKCANLFSALGQTVANGAAYAAQTQADSSAPDAHVVHGVLGMDYDDATFDGHAAGIVLVAPVGNACEGQMVRVAPFQQSCTDVIARLPAGSTLTAELSGVPLYDLGAGQGQALLVPSAGSCVVVTVARAADVP